MLCCLSSVGYQSGVHIERQEPLVCQPAEVGQVHFQAPRLSPCHQSWSGNEGTDVGPADAYMAASVMVASIHRLPLTFFFLRLG